MSTPQTAFDARPLTETVDPRAVSAYAAHLKKQGALGGGSSRVVQIIVIAILGGAFGLVFLIAAVAIIGGIATGGGMGFSLVAFFPIGFVLVAGGLLAMFRWAGIRGRNERWYRLSRFAAANAMTYVPRLPDPTLPGMIFGSGHSRAATDLLRGEQPRFVEFANYRYTTGSGKNQSTHKWGYVAVHLDVPLPHIVLDALSNNGLFGASNLPASFDKDQRLSLEGDFDRFFSLFCPVGYERDALYLFTPDIMARFIDNAAALDVEIVDDWMFLYARRDFSTLDPATWAWLFSVVAALLDKLAQWARWRDERLLEERADAAAYAFATTRAPAAVSADGLSPAAVGPVPGTAPGAPAPFLQPPPGVAQPGRRLSRRFPLLALIVGAVFVVLWIVGQALPVLIGFFSAFVR